MPRIDTLVKLATALEVPPDELIDGIAWTPGDRRPGEFSIKPSEAKTASSP
jgi:hypothetical protein